MTSTITFGFDGKNKRAQRVAKRQAGKLVKEVSAETEAAIRAVIVRSIRDGIPPYDAARLIKSTIGLTTRQAMAAMNFREELINEGLTIDAVDRRTARYADRKLRERSEAIARTEIMTALNTGAEEARNQAVERGLLSEDAKKVWVTGLDERVCPICEPLNGETVPIGQPFNVGGDLLDAPPAHIQCRCTVAVEP